MRVLFVSGSYPPELCGVGDYTQKLALSLASLPCVEVSVLTTRHTARAVDSLVKIFPLFDSWRSFSLWKILRVLWAWRPDVVHFQFPSQGFSGYGPSILPVVLRLFGLPVFQTWHEPYARAQKKLFFLQLAGARGLIFVRPNYLQLVPRSFSRLISLIPHRIIPNASSLPKSTLTPDERAALHASLVDGYRRVIVFFGFLYPHKGIESLFDIANPASDMLIIAGAVRDESFRAELSALATTRGWGRNVRFTGYLPASDAADLLAVADAVVLPFAGGGGEWNTSIHAALAQGTLVITTSLAARGDDPQRNLYTAAPDAIEEMRGALDRWAGRRVEPVQVEAEWQGIASAHIEFYKHTS
ncbi:MAG: glycosyltransferase [Pseudomonadota bacterium]